MTKRNQPTKVVLTMRRKDIRKRKGIRYVEYYNMVEIQDELYRQGMMKKKFYHLMPIIASPQNIRLAYRNLKNNKGSNTPGVDGKTFADYAKLEDVELIRKVQERLLNYQPKAVRRVYIPKSNGKLRPLGIPTVLDRLVQQSILQVLEPVCESKFHRYSYGFRPNRSCKQAVAMCYKLAQVNGYHYVVDPQNPPAYVSPHLCQYPALQPGHRRCHSSRRSRSCPTQHDTGNLYAGLPQAAGFHPQPDERDALQEKNS